MALSNPTLPFGLRDVKVFPIDEDGNVGSGVDLPAGQTFSFKEAETFEMLKGDDLTLASHGGGPTVSWELESGGISMAAYVVIIGGTISMSGTEPNLVQTYTKGALDQKPYFQVEGQAISDSGGDFHTVVYRCKADGGFDGSMANSKFWISKATGTGFGNVQAGGDLMLYQFIQNETVTSIVA
jgi:hypothetical protein